MVKLWWVSVTTTASYAMIFRRHYYVNYVESQVNVTEGTLVKEEYKEELPVGCDEARQDHLSSCQYQGQEKAVA